jgi:hypothetical protein
MSAGIGSSAAFVRRYAVAADADAALKAAKPASRSAAVIL